MLQFLPAPLVGMIASVLMLLNILLWVPILLLVSFVKLLLPFKAVRLLIDPLLLRIAEAWIAGNSGWMRLTQRMDWDVSGIEALSPRQWYLVVCNHQSWVDILVLQHVLNRRIPLLKFFLKKELIWVPIMGLAWWALEFPFMRRHTEAYLKQHPEARGKDAATTRAACQKYALVPTSVMNFLEGTRCTPAKQQRQQSPYQHLLKPKAGGVTLALDAMGDKFGAVLDITIVYPDGQPTFTQFLMGRVKRVIVRVRTLPVPQAQASNGQNAEQALRDTCQQRRTKAVIRTVQELLGHSDVSTTMVYTNVLKVAAGGTVGPLDALGRRVESHLGESNDCYLINSYIRTFYLGYSLFFSIVCEISASLSCHSPLTHCWQVSRSACSAFWPLLACAWGTGRVRTRTITRLTRPIKKWVNVGWPSG